MAKALKNVLSRRLSLALTDRQHKFLTSKRRQKLRGYTTANDFIRDLIEQEMKR